MPFITSKRILEAYFDYGFFGLVVWGPLRSGKSSFAIQVCAEVYGLLNDPKESWRKMIDLSDEEWVIWLGDAIKKGEIKLDWNAWKKWMVFLPCDFFKRVDEAQNAGKQFPLLIWDDAGLWASLYCWNEEFGKRLSEYFNVGATDYACLMYTTPHPNWLLKHMREIPGTFHGQVIKVSGDRSQRWVRRIKIYDKIFLPNFKSLPKAVYQEHYKVLLPPDVFYEYDKVRRTYSWIAKERVKEIVYKIMKKYGKEKAKAIAQRFQQEFGIVLENSARQL